MKVQGVVVLDVGKTNKKIAVYGRDFRVLAEDRIALGTAEWKGLEIERSGEVLAWFREKLREIARDFDIRAISVSAHGATFALLDADGNLALPIVSYTSSVSAEVQDEFYREFGSRDALYRATGSPDLGFVNMAKMLYYVRTRLPKRWEPCRHGLFYAPYFSFALSGRMALEPTFVGNHSYLWDFNTRGWSEVARRLGADRLFGGPMRAPWDALGPLREDWARDCGVGPECCVAVGIHDSNANLLPYLVREQSNFVLASTGTWCVLMRPAATPALTDAQVKAGVFFNQSAFQEPVLTGLLPAGMEYETFASFAPFTDAQDEDALARVISDRDVFVIPGTLPDVPVFPGAAPGLVAGKERFTLDDLRAGRSADTIRALGQRYFAALNLALALATKRALAHLDAPRGARVYIEGGFASNTIYCRLMATLCPEFEWLLTQAKEGTSLGAALCGWAAAEGVDPRQMTSRYMIDDTPIAPYACLHLDPYEHSFAGILKEC